MKKLLSSILMCLPLAIWAQSINSSQDSLSTGINFETHLSWDQVKAQAKLENKYIFVDCYASWCAPCKYMDKAVYSNDTIGEYVNDRFVSVKLQMDSTKEMSSQAQSFQKQFKITGLPTYLFFNPDGKIVLKDMGGKYLWDFRTLVEDALNPEKQYYTLLERYSQRKLKYQDMHYLATQAIYTGDQNIVQDYLENFVLKLSKEQLFTKQNLDFIRRSVRTPRDKGFDFFSRYPEMIDKVMWENCSRSTVDRAITKDEIDPILISAINSKKEPDWEKIVLTIEKKYGRISAERIVMNAKEGYYEYTQNWKQLHKTYLLRYRKYGVGDDSTNANIRNVDGVNNNMAWSIFEHSDDNKIILVAIEWMDVILKNTPKTYKLYEWGIDTYANLLYKAGKNNEAIEWETKALNGAIQKNNQKMAEALKFTLGKMEKGEPTWPIKK